MLLPGFMPNMASIGCGDGETLRPPRAVRSDGGLERQREEGRGRESGGGRSGGEEGELKEVGDI